MFNIEQSIGQWRRQMQEAGVKSPARLDELESHLREDINVLMAAGATEVAAWQSAVARLGAPAGIGGEFDKIKRGQIWPVKIAAAVWIGLVIVFAVFLAGRIGTGRVDFLTYAHIVTATAGYSAGFVTGGFGICFVCLAQMGRLSPERRRSLRQGVRWFSDLGAGLVIVALISGLFVSQEWFGRYWSWDAKEIGALWVVVWLAAQGAMSRFHRISDRSVMLMGIAANIVVSGAWFGAGMMAKNPSLPSYGIATSWPLDTWVGIHVCALALGMVSNAGQKVTLGEEGGSLKLVIGY